MVTLPISKTKKIYIYIYIPIAWGVVVLEHVREVAKMTQNKYADSFGDGYIKAVAVTMCGGTAGLLAVLVCHWHSACHFL